MIQVIVRALKILEFVATHGQEPVQLIKIAEHAGLSQPTTSHIVTTLVQQNYLEQMGRKKGYRLGLASFQLTGTPSFDNELVMVSKEPMEQMTKELNETSLLAVIRNNKRIILHVVDSHQMLRVNTVMVAEVYDTSTGRLLMAYLAPKELDSLLKVIGFPTKEIWPGAQKKEGLEIELEKIRKDKFVQTVSIYHTVGFAVPIYKNKKVIAGLSIFVPESRYIDKHKEKIIKTIFRTAKQITDLLKKDPS